MKKTIKKEDVLNIIKYGIIAYLGVILIKTDFIDESRKTEVILGTLGVAFFFVEDKKTSLKSYFSFKDFWKALLWYSLATVVGIISLYFYSIYFNKEWGASQTTLAQYSLGVVFIQEILFRFILWELGKKIFGNGVTHIIVNTFSFAIMHIVYDGFWINYLWLLMIVAGLLFAILFYFFPKLYLIIPTHSALNATAVYFGIFH